MKMSNGFLLLFLMCMGLSINAATFTLYNFSGRDVFVRPFSWKDQYAKIPAGQKMYFDSGVKSVKDVAWITDMPGKNGWHMYQTKGLELDALKTFKEFRIYPNGKYEENFMFQWVKPNFSQAQEASVPVSILLGDRGIVLKGEQASCLVVENTMSGVVLVRPPVKQIDKKERGFVSGNYDCIAPGGSKVYLIAYNAQDFIEYVMADQKTGNWYGFGRTMKDPLVAGKIQILSDGKFNYMISATGKNFIFDPTRKDPVVRPAGCQLMK